MTPGQFDISITPGGYRVRRRFEFDNAGSAIDLDVQIKAGDKGQVTVDEMHRASLQAAIDHLQSLIPKPAKPAP